MQTTTLMKTLLLCLCICSQALAQIEPDAGTWKTWVLFSGKQYRLPAPPDKKTTETEWKEIQTLQAKQTEAAVQQIKYWNAGAPGYRWGLLTDQLWQERMPAFRPLALLNIAIYDATIAAWDTKYTYNRPRPSGFAKLNTWLPVPQSPSYPCEYSVAAGAASVVLAYLFPQKADSIQKLARQVGESRVRAGIQYPSDVEAGFELGRKVGELVVARARKDGSDVAWNGSVPTKPGLWNGTNPGGPMVGTWKLWALDSASQFRPGPPPDFAKDMAELKNAKSTTQSKARAFFYATQDFWSQITNEKLFEYHLDSNPPVAARIYAFKSIAACDAFVACWESKYTYWGIRPDQYDPTYKAVLATPPFPGYPSGHATTSSAVATMLSYFFPADNKYFVEKARECAESRFEGGIHFRTDNEVGLEFGKKIGEWVIQKAKTDGAEKSKLAKKF